MIITSGIMSSKSDNWATPTNLFNKLNAEFDFNLDPCASAEIRFIKGRVKFGDGKNGAPFPSVIVIWRERENNAPVVKMMEY